MSDAVMVSGVVAVAVFGFAPQNNAMLTAGAERAFRPVIDGMILSICGWLSMFALALGVLYLLPPWMSGTSMVLASLVLALSGLTRYMADPGSPWQQQAGPARPPFRFSLSGASKAGPSSSFSPDRRSADR